MTSDRGAELRRRPLGRMLRARAYTVLFFHFAVDPYQVAYLSLYSCALEFPLFGLDQIRALRPPPARMLAHLKSRSSGLLSVPFQTRALRPPAGTHACSFKIPLIGLAFSPPHCALCSESAHMALSHLSEFLFCCCAPPGARALHPELSNSGIVSQCWSERVCVCVCVCVIHDA